MRSLLVLLSLTAPMLAAPPLAAAQTTARDARSGEALRAAILDAEHRWLATNPDRSFLSVGSDLGYALGWLKEGKYTEAMTPLGLIGEKGAADPFVHLFTALALAGQGQASAAAEALARAERLTPGLRDFRAVITAPAAAAAPRTPTSPPAPVSPAVPASGGAAVRLPAAARVTSMTAALNEAQRLWKATQPATTMFSTNWHVEQILYSLRSTNAEGARVQLSAARAALPKTGARAVDAAFLDLLDGFVAAQLGQRAALDKSLGALRRGPYAAPLSTLTAFLSTYQPPKAAAPPAPAPATRPGGPLVPGDYSCWLERPGLNGARNDVPRGTLSLKANGTYSYMGKAGTYRYNAQSGVLTFTGGPFTNPTPERTTFLKHKTTAQIDLHWAYANDWSCGKNL
ncbi:hypothetical protein [Deinococcus ficus]|uniref:hypothetical protein n=1 Tax=Deinococcus ficus TaxID=317577 RepID=UPI000D58C480|nr:hypothetical protein [Deinococcus ficus]